MNSYELSRNWFNFCFDNPEKIKPIHTAIYFMAIEHCNRLGWKEKFGFPSQMVMEAVGVKNWRTYSKGLNDLVDFGFIKMVETSKNQYSSNIIAIVKNTKAPTKALDKALQKHSTKQGQSTVSIDKQVTKNKEQRFNKFWAIYPKKVNKKDSLSKWMKLTDKEIELISKTIKNFISYKPFEDYTHPNPTTYFNQKRWEDEIPVVKDLSKETDEERKERMTGEIKETWA